MKFDPFEKEKGWFNKFFDYCLLVLCFIIATDNFLRVMDIEWYIRVLGILLIFIVAKLFKILSILETRKK